MDPEIVSKGAFTVAGCLYRGKNEHGEVGQLWDKEVIPRVGELGNPRVFYGLSRMGPECAPGEFEYLAGAEVKSPENAPAGMEAWCIPAQTYAVVPAYEIAELGRIFGEMYAWAKASPDYEPVDGACFELYPETYPDQPTILLHVPVRKRA